MKSLRARLLAPLGVAMAYFVLARHGGDVTVESTLGICTTFVLSLPLAELASIDLEETEDRPVGSISPLG
ncbi:MAG TPA: hypothetical protein VJR05_12660 [Acidimicrobiia bacterium]|nr:hypothetical protein [Acidimicrobiia bacterium]